MISGALKKLCLAGLLLAVTGTAFGYGILVDDTYSTGNRTNNHTNNLSASRWTRKFCRMAWTHCAESWI